MYICKYIKLRRLDGRNVDDIHDDEDGYEKEYMYNA